MGGFNSGGFSPSRIETPDLEVDDGTISVDTGNNRVGIGTTEPSAPLEVQGSILVGGTTPKITIGDAGTEDTMLVFDGNAQDYRIGIDDGTDKLEIGHGGTHGTRAAIIIDSSGDVTKIGTDTHTTGQFLKWDGSKAVWDSTSGGTADSIKADDITTGDAAVTVTADSGNAVTINATAAQAQLKTTTSGEVDITSAANIDINATTGIAADGTTVSIDGTDDSNFTVTGSGKDLDLAVAGGGTQELRLASAGTGASAMHLNASAGGIDIDSADMIDIDAADEITIDTTSADGHIAITSAHTAGQSILISANADAGAILDIDAGIIDIDVQDTIDIDAADEITIDTTSADGHIAITSAHTAGQSILISANADAGAILDIDAGIIDIDVQDTINIDAADEIEIATTSADGHITLTSAHTSGLAFHIDANADAASEVQIDAGVLDVDVTAGITIDGTTVSVDGTDDSNLTVTGSGKDLDLAVAGGGSQELRIASAGTGASALHLNASAGGIDIDSADMIDIDAADEITIDTTSADGHIAITSAHTAGQSILISANADAGSILDVDAGIIDIDVQDTINIDAADEIEIATTSADGHITLTSAHTSGLAFHIDANEDAASEVQIDAGVLDVDVTAGITIDGTTVSVDGTDDSNLTVTGSGKDLDLAVAGGGAQELRLASAGTGASAIHLNASAGGIDIDAADMLDIDAADEITIDTTSADGHIAITSAHTAGQSILISANADAGAILDIDAGIVDIDVQDTINIDAADEIVIATTSADGHITFTSAHTAGQAFHIDANADAGSIVDIDAGILDIDVTAGTTLDTTSLIITNGTTSSATEGGLLRLVCDDGAAMADDHRLGVLEFAGAEDASNTITIGAKIEAICDAGWSASENGAAMLFYTTDGNATQSEVLRLDSNKLATFTGRVITDNNTEATSTTDGSIQTDGGLSVVKDCVFGNDVKLLTDSSVLSMGVGSDVTFTHDGTTGLTIAATPISIDSTGELHLNSTTGDIKLQAAGTDQIALDLDGTGGEVIVKTMVDNDDLVLQQYDGIECARVLDKANAPTNADGIKSGLGFRYPSYDIVADGSSTTVTLTAADSGADIGLVPLDDDIIVNLPTGIRGMFFYFHLDAVVPSGKSVKIQIANTPGANDDFIVYNMIPGSSNGAVDNDGNKLTIPATTAKGGIVKVRCMIAGSDEVWLAECLTSVACTAAD